MQADVGIFNSMIAACAHGGEYAKARHMFDSMAEHGCEPDAVTYANLIRAFKKGGQWCAASCFYRSSKTQGFNLTFALKAPSIPRLSPCRPPDLPFSGRWSPYSKTAGRVYVLGTTFPAGSGIFRAMLDTVSCLNCLAEWWRQCLVSQVCCGGHV